MPSDQSELVGPGVFEVPFRLPDGSRPILAIDADGVVRGRYYLQPGEDAGAVTSFLESRIGGSSLGTGPTPENSNLELVE